MKKFFVLLMFILLWSTCSEVCLAKEYIGSLNDYYISENNSLEESISLRNDKGDVALFKRKKKINQKNNDEKVKENSEVKSKNKTILIDPGHGGFDGGAVSKNGVSEKNINLSIALILKDKLEKEGYKVFLTRDSDVGLYGDIGTVKRKKSEDLNCRSKMIKSTNCDGFISIHLNKFEDSRCKGAQVWYANNEESQKFATEMQNSLKENLEKTNHRKEKPAMNAYRILRNVDKIPCIIVECGFLSNYEEEKKLQTVEYQEQIANAILMGVNAYFK